MKAAIVLGSTGLIGSELVKLLQASPHYSSVILLNRRPSGHVGSKISETIIDFAAPDLSGTTGDDLYCALGTTRRKAGSESAQYQVDYEYPALIAARLKTQGVKRIALVSSVGADVQAGNFYLRTKGKLEETIIGTGFEQTVIARPSVLIGQRAEFRLGEEAAILFLKLLSPLMIGGLRKYRGIEASTVARCLVRGTNSGPAGVRFVESDKIQGFA
jgi:uncharacterized protein YbjT (DUF2867 family)